MGEKSDVLSHPSLNTSTAINLLSVCNNLFFEVFWLSYSIKVDVHLDLYLWINKSYILYIDILITTVYMWGKYY